MTPHPAGHPRRQPTNYPLCSAGPRKYDSNQTEAKPNLGTLFSLDDCGDHTRGAFKDIFAGRSPDSVQYEVKATGLAAAVELYKDDDK